MSKTSIPKNYHDLLGLYDTQRAIGIIKTIFQEKLCAALHLKRVTAPLFVLNGSGLNDDLNGVERPVSFDVPCLDERAEVVHSLAKWKRYALAEYGFRPGQGLVTDMNAIRRDEELDNLHSIYVDQWDWEKVITAKDRTLPFLQETVRDIVDAVCSTADELRWKFPELKAIRLTREPTFITTQELEDLYPDLTPKERENAFTRAHGTVCIMQIGGQLKSGIRHDGRAPDYDDWTLNCDILFWHKPLDCALELSSMGIRVDADALRRRIREIENNKDATAVEQDLMTTLEVCYEFCLRGFHFEPIDIYRSDATKFVVTENGLLPPFTSVRGLGETAALDTVEKRKGKDFTSVEEFSLCCNKLSQTHIDQLRALGAFAGLPETSQLTLF